MALGASIAGWAVKFCGRWADGPCSAGAVRGGVGALAEMEQRLPGLVGHMEPDNPGMQSTATVDFEYVVSGRCVLELDDGVSCELSAGDTVVQNGTRHAWRNPYDEPCLLVVALFGAHHDGI